MTPTPSWIEHYKAFVAHLTPWLVEDSQPDVEAAGYMSSTDREVADIEEAHVISSLRRGTKGLLSSGKHDVVLDLDVPAMLVPSTTPGHTHLIVRLPDGGAEKHDYDMFLHFAAKIGLIEEGYAEVSTKRGHSDVRLPWIRKGGEGEEPFIDTRSTTA